MHQELEKPSRSPAALGRFATQWFARRLSRWHPGASDSLGMMGGSLRACIHTGFPDDALAVGIRLGIPQVALNVAEKMRMAQKAGMPEIRRLSILTLSVYLSQ